MQGKYLTSPLAFGDHVTSFPAIEAGTEAMISRTSTASVFIAQSFCSRTGMTCSESIALLEVARFHAFKNYEQDIGVISAPISKGKQLTFLGSLLGFKIPTTWFSSEVSSIPVALV